MRALPEGSLDLRVLPDAMSIRTMLLHMHYRRLVFAVRRGTEFGVDPPIVPSMQRVAFRGAGRPCSCP